MVIVIVVTVLAIVYVQQGRRNVPIMYPQKSQVFYAIQRGKSVRMPQPTLPLMVNLSGMIPLIFASAILQFPAIIASYFTQSQTAWVSTFCNQCSKLLQSDRCKFLGILDSVFHYGRELYVFLYDRYF